MPTRKKFARPVAPFGHGGLKIPALVRHAGGDEPEA
jgi:hypothetical protein